MGDWRNYYNTEQVKLAKSRVEPYLSAKQGLELRLSSDMTDVEALTRYARTQDSDAFSQVVTVGTVPRGVVPSWHAA